jgi:bifunctional non-homologous end joining protein LigD
MLAYKDGARVQLISRNGRDYTRRFRNIAATIGKLSARTLVLDGEIAIFDQQLRSRFEWLREPDPDAVASPPLLLAFDLLYCDRRGCANRPCCFRNLIVLRAMALSTLLPSTREIDPRGDGAPAHGAFPPRKGGAN